MSRAKRLELAELLEDQGVTVDQLDRVRSYVRSVSSDSAVAQRTFVGIMIDPKRREEAIEDVGKRVDVWQARKADEAKPVYWGESLWLQRGASEWDERDVAHAIRCYRKDGRTDEEIMEALDITREQMEDLQ